MPKLKPGTIFPTEIEDNEIRHATQDDPDSSPLTDAEWEQAKSNIRIGAVWPNEPTIPSSQEAPSTQRLIKARRAE